MFCKAQYNFRSTCSSLFLGFYLYIVSASHSASGFSSTPGFPQGRLFASRLVEKRSKSCTPYTDARTKSVIMRQQDGSASTPNWDLAWKVYLLERTMSLSIEVSAMLWSIEVFLICSQLNHPKASPHLSSDIENKKSLSPQSSNRAYNIKIPPIYANLNELNNLLKGMLLILVRLTHLGTGRCLYSRMVAKERLFLVIQADRARQERSPFRPVPLAAIASRSLLRELIRTSHSDLKASEIDTVQRTKSGRIFYWGSIILRRITPIILLILGTYLFPFYCWTF